MLQFIYWSSKEQLWFHKKEIIELSRPYHILRRVWHCLKHLMSPKTIMKGSYKQNYQIGVSAIKSLWKYICSFLFPAPKCESTDITKKLKKLDNSCALTTLSRVYPSLSYERISDAFYNCCDKWPQAGVTHKEFNIILRYIGIFDKFLYNESKGLTFRHYIGKKKIVILLIPGHFTVVCNGTIYDSYGYSNLSKDTKVYCAWSLR